MKMILLFFSLIVFQEQVPFKPSDEFQVNIDLKFKVKKSEYGVPAYSATGERLDKATTATYPFLSVSISQIKIQSDEIKIMVKDSSGKSLFKKKTNPVPELHFEMGFVDELKSKSTSSEVTVYFMSADKKELRKIVIAVLANGVFEVNGKWHGQF